MTDYRYQYGDRPLDGYTVQHGIGRGGFGEVYYALSDTGRQVALKCLTNYQDIELRGLSHCMNLKSPHLVSIFDVKYNQYNQPFVLMEYVSGPSLRQLIDDSPGGLGTAKTAFFLREIAKGLTYLHDCGIVHRDLKPHNIFYEDGYVKIGDYSLSKAISNTHHSAHTVTVGTVHYMAPEIGQGVYNRGIDIYALGAMVYEMLTGQPPFIGSSHGEVLMKHLTADLDLTGIDQPFKRAIEKAMAKDPADRYESVRQMVEDVFGAEHIQQSVTSFNAADLTMVAGRVAGKVNPTPGHPARPTPPTQADRQAPVRPAAVAAPRPFAPQRPPGRPEVNDGVRVKPTAAEDQGTSLAYLTGRMVSGVTDAVGLSGRKPRACTIAQANAHDPIGSGERRKLGLITLLVVATGTFLFGVVPQTHDDLYFVGWIGCLISISVGVLGIVCGDRWFGDLSQKSGLSQRLMIGGTTSVFYILAMFLFGMVLGVANTWNYLLGVIITLFVLDWPRIISPLRPKRLMFGYALTAGLVVFLLTSFLTHNDDLHVMLIGIMVGVVIVVQVVYPFIPREMRRRLGPNPQTPAPSAKDQSDVQPAQPTSDSAKLNRLNVSPSLRLPALLLTFIFPVCGLQRFYVGKIGTGLFWLFTCGMFGIGQLIDLIMIAGGQFTDAHGRRVLAWASLNEIKNLHRSGLLDDAPPNAYQQAYGSDTPTWRPTGASNLLSMVGGVFLLAGLLAAVFYVLQIPHAIAAGLFDGMDRELDRLFGYNDWPQLLERVAFGVIGIFLLLAAVIMVMARRGGGFMHVLRVPVACAGLGFAIILVASDRYGPFSHIALDWNRAIQFWDRGSIGPALETLMDGFTFARLAWGLIFFVGSVILLAMPSRRRLVLRETEREVAA